MKLRSSTNPGTVITVLQHDTNFTGDALSSFQNRSREERRSPSVSNLPTVAPQLPEVRSMAMSGFQISTSPTMTSTLTNGTNLTPLHHNTRRLSADQSSSPQLNGGPQHNFSSPASQGSPWSSAIGHAGTGKSGRVIEKLMADNDKLKRELKEQMVKAEEFQRSLQTIKPQMEALQAEIDNLSHAKGVDRSLLARRDRQIKDLKDELGLEKQKRQSLESRSQTLQYERDEAMEERDREVQTYMEKEKHATNHADILGNSLKNLRQTNETYKQTIGSLQKDISALQVEKDQDRHKLAKLDVVSDQMRQESERSKKIQADIVAKLEELQELREQEMQDIKNKTHAENERSRQLSVEMNKVVQQMKWVMGVKVNTGLDESG